MRAYLAITGAAFALVTIAHVARTGELLTRLDREPWFVAGYALLTMGTAALSVWAWRLFLRLPRSSTTVPPHENS